MTDDVPVSTAPEAGPAAASPPLSERIGFASDRFFLLLAIIIGVLSGAAVVCFRILIDWTHNLLLGPDALATGPRLLIVPGIAGLVVAALVIHFFPRARGSGVNQTKAALYIYDGYIGGRTGIGKFITSALAIGSGQSLGPEDPSLQIGATLASAVGRRLQLSREKLRLLAPVGAAAGLAAAFNAPISAVLFVIEEVIGRWSAGVLGAVVLSAVSSVVVARSFLGGDPLFRIPAMEASHPEELLAYSVLGVVGGVAAVVFSKAIGTLRSRLKAMPRATQYFQPAIAGVLIGIIGWLGLPQVMGAGYEYIDQALHDQFTWKILLLLAVGKLLATTVSFVSGTPGGMFAPTLFIGAMFGAAVGSVERIFFPSLGTSIPAFALVGMGVMFAGFLRAPLTSVFMILEVSGNYEVLLPVIVANTIAYVIARTFQPTPIFDLLTKQDGLELPSMEEQREEAVLRVEDAMEHTDIPVLDGTQAITDALARESGQLTLIRIGPREWRLASWEDLKAEAITAPGVRLSDLQSPRPIPHVYPDSSLESALRLAQPGFPLPVVHRAEAGLLLGIITVEAILGRYREMAELQHE
jgi:CIC family chloride channel protein